MDWSQVLTIIIANSALFLWARSESRKDYLHMEKRTDAILKSIQDEIKDFHGRLCEIEAKRKA